MFRRSGSLAKKAAQLEAEKITRNQIKHLRALRAKKYRQEHQQFVVEGETIVGEVLDRFPSELRYLIGTVEFIESMSPATVQRLAERVVRGDYATMKNISALDTPSPVMALLDMPAHSHCAEPVRGLTLYLDGIRDPGNLGAIMRVADWYGIHRVYLAEDCVDVYNAKTIQASMGAFLRVTAPRVALDTLRAASPGLSIVGTRIEGGIALGSYDWNRDTLLVIGSESQGIRPDNVAMMTDWLSIPRGNSNSGAESLNAAVATGILCANYNWQFPS